MPFRFLIPAIANGTLGAAVNAYGIAKQAQGVKDTNAMNYKIAHDKMEFDKQMWREQMEYNTPANQMARYRAAGLNPHMMFGSVSSGNATSAPTAPMPVMENPYGHYVAGMQGLASHFLAAERQSAEISKIKAEEGLLRKQAGESEYRSSLISEQTETQKQQTSYWAAKALSENVGANVAQATEQLSIAVRYMEMENLSADTKEIMARTALAEINKSLQGEKVTTERFMRGLEREKLDLQKRIFSFEKKKFGIDYGLRYDQVALQRYEADLHRYELVAKMEEFMLEFELHRKRLGYDMYEGNRRYDLDKSNSRMRNYNDFLRSVHGYVPTTSAKSTSRSYDYSSRTTVRDSRGRKKKGAF